MILSTTLLVMSAAAASLPGSDASWKSLTEKPVPVECTEHAGKPWCRSTGIIHAPIDQVSDAIRNMRYNQDKFEAIIQIDVLSEDVLRVVLDYPAPLDDRDYVAKFVYVEEGTTELYRFTPTSRSDAPEVDGIVRLTNYEGEWRLEPRDEGTWIRYTWQAEINGSFPSFALPTAWKRAGAEALGDLAKTQGAQLSAP